MAESKNYNNFKKLPLPIIVTDINGKVISKNLIAKEYLNLRMGCSLYKYANDEDVRLVKYMAEKNRPAVMTLSGGDFACCALVIPDRSNEDLNLILTAIPYAPEFYGKPFALDEKEEFFKAFDSKIKLLTEALEGNLPGFSDKEINGYKYRAIKLKRLEKRLYERLSSPLDAMRETERPIFNTVELCSFLSRMCDSFNKLSGIVGFRLIYIPLKSYCPISLNSTYLAKMFVYISAYCVKYLDASGMNVYVEEQGELVKVIFESNTKETTQTTDSFDLTYISYCANALGAKTVCNESQRGNSTLELHFTRTATGTTVLSYQNMMFDVTEKFITKTISEAVEFFAE